MYRKCKSELTAFCIDGKRFTIVTAREHKLSMIIYANARDFTMVSVYLDLRPIDPQIKQFPDIIKGELYA